MQYGGGGERAESKRGLPQASAQMKCSAHSLPPTKEPLEAKCSVDVWNECRRSRAGCDSIFESCQIEKAAIVARKKPNVLKKSERAATGFVAEADIELILRLQKSD